MVNGSQADTLSRTDDRALLHHPMQRQDTAEKKALKAAEEAQRMADIVFNRMMTRGNRWLQFLCEIT